MRIFEAGIDMVFLGLLNGLCVVVVMTALSVDEAEEVGWDGALGDDLSGYVIPFCCNLKLELVPDFVRRGSSICICVGRGVQSVTLCAFRWGTVDVG